MEQLFSLCIPTMGRFDTFLKSYLEKYFENDLISEIIITDETGEDVDKIRYTFGDNPKLKLYKNETRLGPFLNKLKACSFAKNKWIVLMDSDNFADKDYFITAKNYIENDIKDINKTNIILAPSFAKPQFNFSHLSGFIYKNGEFNNNLNKEKELFKQGMTQSNVLMNAGNYVINKYLIDNLNLTNEHENIKMSSACDVIYFNTLLFEQLDLHLHVVKDLEYDHVVHNGSIYLQTANKYQHFNNLVYNRYNNLV
jgi:hypothetical protein